MCGTAVAAHPHAELHVFPPVHLHALVQQANLLKVQPVHHEAANQGRASGTARITTFVLFSHSRNLSNCE